MNKTTGEKFPCKANDTSTAADNHAVLKAFFKGFPEFAKNEFFITGESYAGIYIPMLAEQIMLDHENEINLKENEEKDIWSHRRTPHAGHEAH